MTAGVPETHLDAWRALLNAHTSVVAHAEEALAAAELPPLAWYDVLWAIRRAPARRIRMAELASSLTISRGGLTKLADRLENAGLIRREPADTDGRGLYAVLTDRRKHDAAPNVAGLLPSAPRDIRLSDQQRGSRTHRRRPQPHQRTPRACSAPPVPISWRPCWIAPCGPVGASVPDTVMPSTARHAPLASLRVGYALGSGGDGR